MKVLFAIFHRSCRENTVNNRHVLEHFNQIRPKSFGMDGKHYMWWKTDPQFPQWNMVKAASCKGFSFLFSQRYTTHLFILNQSTISADKQFSTVSPFSSKYPRLIGSGGFLQRIAAQEGRKEDRSFHRFFVSYHFKHTHTHKAGSDVSKRRRSFCDCSRMKSGTDWWERDREGNVGVTNLYITMTTCSATLILTK